MVILPSIRRKYMVNRIPKGATVPMSECVVTLANDSVAYTGQPRTVGVTVKWYGETLAVNVDYTLSYANNKNLGPATVTVTGMGQFSGSVTKTFYIVAGAEGWQDFDLSRSSLVGSASISDGGTTIADLQNLQILPDGRLFFANQSTQRMYIWKWENGAPAASFDSRSDAVNYTYGAYLARNGLSFIHAGSPFYGTFARGLSSAFDLSSVSGSDVTVNSSYRTVQFLSADGKHLAWKVFAGNEIQVKTMDVAYDYGNIASFKSKNMSGYDAEIASATGEGSGSWRGMCFSDDGLYLVAVWGNCVLKLGMSVPWDVTTCSLSSFFKPSQSAEWGALAVSPAGDRLIVANTSDNKLYEYDLVA